MAIGVDGRIGVLNAGSSAPSTLAAYLASIGKNSSWGLWEAGTGMWANSDGTGSVSNGTQVHRWEKADGNNFTAYWVQSTAGKGPTYGSSVQGSPAIYGDGDYHGIVLSSNTPVNSTYTLGVRFNSYETAASYVFSHGTSGTANTVQTASGGGVTTRSGTLANTASNQVPCLISVYPTSGTTGEVVVLLNGTASNTTASLLMRSSDSGWSRSGIRKVMLLSGQQLTRVEMDTVAGILGA